MDTNLDKNEVQLQRATLGGGCFWCLEAVYDRVNGVQDVVSGYSNGEGGGDGGGGS